MATGIANSGTITVLSNFGSITNGTFPGLNNQGTITTLNNLQGGSTPLIIISDDATSPVHTQLPKNYNIIIKSPSEYGKLAEGGGGTSTSTMNFGIYSDSVVAAATYSSVLDGILASNLANTQGVFGAYDWSLVNSSGTLWDLIFTPAFIPPATVPNIDRGLSFTLADIGTAAQPVFDGGSLTLAAGNSSSQAFAVQGAGGVITAPANGTASLSGAFSGAGGLTFEGAGEVVLSGNNTYSGGTTVASGALGIAGDSALGTGAVYVAAPAMLHGTGTIAGPITVAGTFKPGNSPGYIRANSSVTMVSGSTYQQDIAGTVQASGTSPADTGYYSFLSTGGQFAIGADTTLSPRLADLFTPSEPGYGSAAYTPALGDRFRIVTADGGIAGRFSTLTQPAQLAPGTQFIAFYNLADSNSLDLALVPTSYAATLSAGNANTRAAASALDQMRDLNQSGAASGRQDEVLYAASGQNAASLASFTQSLSGQVYGATLAAAPQAALRLQQAVVARLGESRAQAGASQGSSAQAVAPDGKVWVDLVYQGGHRSGDDYASSHSSSLFQAVVGTDTRLAQGATVGGGVAFSNTSVSASQGSGTVQEGSLFLYGNLPVQDFVVDGMASFGLTTTDASRHNLTGYGGKFKANDAWGNSALLSVGISRPWAWQDTVLTPYARLTWQRVAQSSFNEESSPAALDIGRYTGNGVRGVLGLAAGSLASDPLAEAYTYKAYAGVGADAGGLIRPRLDAALGGIATTIYAPTVGRTFVQAGVHGTARFARNAYAYLGVSGEARRGATLGAVNAGLRVAF
ncbi:autotransporter outer membrane beta-barrel domain-containing protein [Pollutimonas bauzanensis]|uniref:autotransporter outer membrane beta-barrel domain-containing protein n=1 Tax=Pollutimonas bauzanensis TaxID=658167 RepID=UPI0015B5751C|nr:autotransporter outer membrane beta-barrel domain-containing protein [Pollutimonas bauzanensis]